MIRKKNGNCAETSVTPLHCREALTTLLHAYSHFKGQGLLALLRNNYAGIFDEFADLSRKIAVVTAGKASADWTGPT
jgi:hypothetical protein